MSDLQIHQQILDLQNKIFSLKISLVKAIEEREYLLRTVKPSIEANYQLKIGVFQIELTQIEVEARRLKKMIHKIQADINQDRKPDIVKIEKELEKEFQKWYRQIKNEAEKIEKAQNRFNNQMTDSQSAEFKKLFRELVKKLHPDINSNLSEAEKEVWLKVLHAYNHGDLEELRALSVLMESSNDGEQIPKEKNELQSQVDSLTIHLKRTEEEITTIQNAHPFDLIDPLDDKSWVENKQSEILDHISQWKQMIMTYADIIEKLLGFKINTLLD
ncbi:MAG: hypothetical protein ISR83_07345 [Candidatus Marinimicrobia bacterium]|nr:hypothetical protein [Candidatus Neomarinimicrobiota bacterium]